MLAIVLAASFIAQNATPTPRAERVLGYYDTTLKRVVLISGAAQAGPSDRDSVWSWTGTRWEPMSAEGPLPQANGAAAYDARRGVGVVSGGARRSTSSNTWASVTDTWEASGSRFRKTDAAVPGPRDHHSMVFDESRGMLVLFGGILASRSLPWPSDTWELGPAGWTRIATEGPEGRGRTALAYDGRRRQIVLFAGVSGAPRGEPQIFFGDTWVWDNGSWRKVADTGPRGRYAHGMVFDERRGAVLLYSGAAAHRDAPLSDMWQWDGERWTEIPLSGPTPGFRYQPVMVYDRARDRTVLFGGSPDGKADTWEWDGRAWKEIVP